MATLLDDRNEWLEADGLGGFASGTATGIRTRRYHALLLTALTPPTGRVVLVNGLEAWLHTPTGSFALTSHRYGNDVVHPDGVSRLETFQSEPWPRWSYRVNDEIQVLHELVVQKGTPTVALSWRLSKPAPNVRLTVRPLLSGRDYHALHRENAAFRFSAEQRGQSVVWRPYDTLPDIVAISNGDYAERPDWYRNFSYTEERARGLDDGEDLASPGVFEWDLSADEAVLLLTTGPLGEGSNQVTATSLLRDVRRHESRRRRKFQSKLFQSADAYLVRRGEGSSIVAGYPWFTDWGRDTFIALRGLCLATGRIDRARDILVQWADTVSEGMLPNRFPDAGDAPEFNSVDASLWYVIAVHDFFRAVQEGGKRVAARDKTRLQKAIEAIVSGYARGTRYGIHADTDGLLACGVPGVQLTWMDSKIGDWVVTPRVGKPVEVQALWVNALWIASSFSASWKELFLRSWDSVQARFWNGWNAYLYDVIDVDHQPGTADASFRPNQILAVGGLPLALFENGRARRVVDAVEARLWTPLGLRSLAPGSPGYVSHYIGDGAARDAAYHQGTVWPWLSGPFVEAWVRVRGRTPDAKREARTRFLQPLLQHLEVAGLGHISEIADADAPHTPRGCPFQAWSLGELVRLDAVVLAESNQPTTSRVDMAPALDRSA